MSMSALEKWEKDYEELSKKLDECKAAKEKDWDLIHLLYGRLEDLRALCQHEEFLAYKDIQVGDGITLNLHSDSHAFTVIKRTPKTITVQRDKATLKDTFKPEFSIGGFFAHCTNQDEQEYDYERDTNGRVLTLRWSEKRKKWVNDDYCVSTSYGRHEYYDYNF